MPYFRQYRSLWDNTYPGATDPDPGAPTLAVRFQFDVAGRVVGLRYFRDLADGGNHVGWLMDDPITTVLRSVAFPRVPGSGSGPDKWHHAYVHPTLSVPAGGTVYASVTFFAGHYSYAAGAVTSSAKVNGDVSAPVHSGLHQNGIYLYGNGLPITSGNGTIYGVDVLFQED